MPPGPVPPTLRELFAHRLFLLGLHEPAKAAALWVEEQARTAARQERARERAKKRRAERAAQKAAERKSRRGEP